MARPRVMYGDVLQMRRLAANILNNLSRAAGRGWSFSLGVGRGDNDHSKNRVLRNVTLGLGLGRILWNYLGNGKFLD